jgi:glutathione S-transferase
MIRLYFAPRTRSIRIAWLLEELELPYELVRVTFRPTAREFFVQDTPTGKLPTIEDGGVVMSESGAIVEYLLERYGDGRLAPPVGTPERARYLQWLHFAEATTFPPLGILVWLTRYRTDAADHPALVEDALQRARRTLGALREPLRRGPYLLGSLFTAADIMLGFTLIAATELGVLDDTMPELSRYVATLIDRPALQKVLSF